MRQMRDSQILRGPPEPRGGGHTTITIERDGIEVDVRVAIEGRLAVDVGYDANGVEYVLDASEQEHASMTYDDEVSR